MVLCNEGYRKTAYVKYVENSDPEILTCNEGDWHIYVGDITQRYSCGLLPHVVHKNATARSQGADKTLTSGKIIPAYMEMILPNINRRNTQTGSL